ncbi:MAG TPA: PEP/pyruvate-binding domain-containing protein, partial [Polyangiaceae bacterium]
ALAADPAFEGVLTIVRKGDRAFVDRLDFSSWPEQAVLARAEPSGTFRFCRNQTPGEPNASCEVVQDRAVGDHERRLLTPGDFHALAAARGGVGIESVEFLIDMAWGDAITLLNSANWDLHYSYVREAIEGQRRLDRCIPEEHLEFQRGWFAFSEANYFRVEGRRYLLGNFVRHAGANLQTVEFAAGDTISPAQMRRAFYAALTKVPDPEKWSVRPTATDQIERLRSLEGELPLVGPNAPFRGVTFQALTPAVAFGTLRFVPAAELRKTPLGPRDIVVTDEVPNDIPLIGGLVTEAFQTPLAHVNVLSRGRGTPNMALRSARDDARLEPYFGRLVKLEVTGSDFSIEDAVPEEALAFWESRLPEGVLAPRIDTEPRGVQPLEARAIGDLPSVGGKAAQMAELLKVRMCDGRAALVPDRPFAIPVVHSLEHYQASGALALLEELRADPNFAADPLLKDQGLSRVRARVLGRRVDPELLSAVKAAIRERWPGQPLRFRSSSNTEDLPGFSGAGLYTSEGIEAEDVQSGVEDAIRSVWASLWERRAYDEREYSGVDQKTVAMAVLVHPAYKSERVNGVAISRDALQPQRGDRYYVNAQLGEALVTNPAPGVDSEQFTYELYWVPRIAYHSRSSFSPDAPVIDEAEAAALACNLYQIHQHFRPLLDPQEQNSWFAMDIEWKLMGDDRQLVIKQARAYSFGEDTPTGWCAW